MTLVPSAIAVVVAIFVPWRTFRFALNQSRIDRLHDHRAELYVDLLTEALAEKAYFEFEIESAETQERMRPNYHDLHLPPLERARLGARGTIFGSSSVNALFNKLQGVALMTTMVGRPKNEG